MNLWPQLQSRPTPEMFQGVPAIAFNYSLPCRESFSFEVDGLQINTVYATQISTLAAGPWTNLMFFALLEPDEITAKARTIEFNNDYLGNYFFRIIRYFQAGSVGFLQKVIRKPSKPMASVIAPPAVSIPAFSYPLTGMPDITEASTDDMFQPLSFYRSNGINLAYSSIELHNSMVGSMYCRFSKKYGGRGDGNNAVLLGDTIGAGQPVTVTPLGLNTAKFTRDNSDPLLTTIQSVIRGVADNADVREAGFCGIIKARQFNDTGCKSPLTLVALDKSIDVKNETKFTLAQVAGYYAAYCDQNRNFPAPGGAESGLSCLALYGGIGPFELGVKNYSGGSGYAYSYGGIVSIWTVSSSDSGPDWLGWTNHHANVSHDAFFQCDWVRTARYNGYATLYNWYGFASKGTENVPGNAPSLLSVTRVGIDSISSAACLPSFQTNSTLMIGATIPPDLHVKHCDRSEIMQSAMPLSIDFWGRLITDLTFVPAPEPNHEPVVFNDLITEVENWEWYPVETMDGATLNLATDIFAGQWIIHTLVSNDSLETFETYVLGTIENTRVVYPSELGTYYFYNSGEGWQGAWTIRTYDIDIEDFDSTTYLIGSFGDDMLNAGTGFTGFWQVQEPLGGIESFEEFANGFVLDGAASPLNYYLIGDWIAHSYTPAIITSLAFWGDMSDITTLFQDSTGLTPVVSDSDPVGKITDKSGNANHAIQATSSFRPLYKTNRQNGKSSLLFDGVDDFLKKAISTAGKNKPGVTLCWVFKHPLTPRGNLGGLVGNAVGGSRNTLISDLTVAGQISSFGRRLDANAGQSQESTLLVAGWHDVIAVFDTTNAVLNQYINGTLNGTRVFQTAGNTDVTDCDIYLSFSTQFFNSEMLEVAIYDKALSTAERGIVENYFRDKYAVY